MKKLLYLLVFLTPLIGVKGINAASNFQWLSELSNKITKAFRGPDLKQLLHRGKSKKEIFELIDEQEGIDIITKETLHSTPLEKLVVISNGHYVVHINTIKNIIHFNRSPLDPITRESLPQELITHIKKLRTWTDLLNSLKAVKSYQLNRIQSFQSELAELYAIPQFRACALLIAGQATILFRQCYNEGNEADQWNLLFSSGVLALVVLSKQENQDISNESQFA